MSKDSSIEFERLKRQIFYPGDRVLVFDHRLFKDDKETPLTETKQRATVIRHYGTDVYLKATFHDSLALSTGRYESLVDVIFDYDGRESKGHFGYGIERL